MQKKFFPCRKGCLMPWATILSVLGYWVMNTHIGGTLNLKYVEWVLILLLLAIATSFDITYHLIPNKLLFAGLMGISVIIFLQPEAIWDRLYAVGGMGLILGIISTITYLWKGKPGFGAGDIKLLLLMSLVLRWQCLEVFYIAVFSAGLLSVPGLFVSKLEKTTRIPFAPFIFIGFLGSYLLQPLSWFQ